jgi:dihydrofolate reductase
MITLIAAVNHNMLLGKDNKIPWHVKDDLEFFKQQTLHKTVLMGRKTFESLPKKLKDRKIFVLTNQHNYRIEDNNCTVVFDVSDVIDHFKDSQEELMVAGGGMVYQLMMPHSHKILLSVIDDYQHGDVYFPSINACDFALINKTYMDTFTVLEYQRHV